MSDAPALPAADAGRSGPESARARLAERFEQFASDIFALEINTILKENITATPWPGPCHGLLDIASEYQARLGRIQQLLVARDPDAPGLAELVESRRRRDAADTSNTASHARFDDLRTWAKALCPALDRSLAGGSGESDSVMHDVSMINRIRDNSDQIKGVFDVLRARLRSEPPLITRDNANKLVLDLREQDLATIRKIWEIGTEEVVMQTVIHLDGDVVLRVRPDYAGEGGRPVLNLHNNSVQTAVGFWQKMVGVIGSALRWFVGK